MKKYLKKNIKLKMFCLIIMNLAQDNDVSSDL